MVLFAYVQVIKRHQRLVETASQSVKSSYRLCAHGISCNSCPRSKCSCVNIVQLIAFFKNTCRGGGRGARGDAEAVIVAVLSAGRGDTVLKHRQQEGGKLRQP